MTETDLGLRTIDQTDSYGEMTRVLIKAEALPLEDKRKLLKFEKDERPSRNGTYRYDLLLHPKSQPDDSSSICMKVIPSLDMGVSFDYYEEIMWSERSATKERAILLRTGYLQMDDSTIRDIRSTGVIRDTSVAMVDTLRVNFPNHVIIVQDVDGHDSGLGIV